MPADLRIIVGIATAGRQEVLLATLRHVAAQSRKPDMILICPASAGDFDLNDAAFTNVPIEIVHSERGLTLQRNAIIKQAEAADFLIFFDDDYFPQRDFIKNAEKLFVQEPAVFMATGHVLADGITGPGIAISDANEILLSANPVPNARAASIHNAYGCNMVLRMAPVIAHGLLFDEALPLYGWLEDVDFSRRLARFGRIVKSPALLGVHLGAKGGRNSGIRFGYSQIANPVHLMRKSSLSWNRASAQMIRNVVKNIARSWKTEPWIDRRGRCRGNALAISDLCRGRLTPRRILDLD